MPKLAELARAFDTTSTTIRRWASDHAPYMSDGANPPAGEARTFTDNDGRVLALVAKMRGKNKPLEEINAALLEGDRGKWPPEGMGIDGEGEQDAPPPLQLVTTLTAELAHRTGELKSTEEERDRLLASLENERAARLEAEKMAATAPMLEAELERTRADVERVRAERDHARLPWYKRMVSKALEANKDAIAAQEARGGVTDAN